MGAQSVAATLVIALVIAACGGIGGEVKSGEPMAKLCEAAQALGDAVGLGQAAVATRNADDSSSGRYITQADTRRTDADTLVRWASDREGAVASPSPGFAEAAEQTRAAQKPVDKAVMALLGRPNADAATEARLLDEGGVAVLAIKMPAECVRIPVPSATP